MASRTAQGQTAEQAKEATRQVGNAAARFGAATLLIVMACSPQAAVVTQAPVPAPSSPAPSGSIATPTPSPSISPARTAPAATPTSLPTLIPIPPTASDFEIRLNAPLVQWTAQPIALDAALVYHGPEPQITLWSNSDDLVQVSFGMTNGALSMGGLLDSGCNKFTLVRDEPVAIPIVKWGDWEADDPNADFYATWLADPELHLPVGAWEIEANAFLLADRVCSTSTVGPVHVNGSTFVRVTPIVPLAMPDSGCTDELNEEYGLAPETLLVNGDTPLRLTMFSGWAWRDGGGGGDADYGYHDVDLPDQPFVIQRGDTVAVQVGQGFQLIDASATRYAAQTYIVDRHGLVDPGKALAKPAIAYTRDGGLSVATPEKPGQWVIQVRVNWLTPCLIGDGEVNFGVETH
jgi:hypothetical protein